MLTNNDMTTTIELGSGSNQMNSYLPHKNNNKNNNNNNYNDDDVNMIHQYKESETGNVESSELEPINNNINYNNQQKLIRTSLWYANVSNLVLFLALLVGFIILIALGSATYYKVQHLDRSTVTTAYVSLGLPGNEGLSWNDIIEQSAGSTVNFWMWSGDDHINSWVDDIFIPSVFEKYDIKVFRHTINDTSDAVDQMIIDQKIVNNNNNNNKGGLVDLVWINGENLIKLCQIIFYMDLLQRSYLLQQILIFNQMKSNMILVNLHVVMKCLIIWHKLCLFIIRNIFQMDHHQQLLMN